MRSSVRSFALGVLVLTAVCFSFHELDAGAKSREHRVLKAYMYMWALSTGGIKVDLQSDKLEAFTRAGWTDEKEREKLEKQVGSRYFVYRTSAKISKSEAASLTKLIEKSGLHDFTPQPGDIKERMPYCDECPPTLVLFWDDKKQVISLPLTDTVKQRTQYYRSMETIYQRLLQLQEKYRKPPYI